MRSSKETAKKANRITLLIATVYAGICIYSLFYCLVQPYTGEPYYQQPGE